MKRLAFSASALGLLIIGTVVLYEVGTPSLGFNRAIHILLGAIGAWLAGDFWEWVSPKSFAAADKFFLMGALTAGALSIGVLVELFEYQLWGPELANFHQEALHSLDTIRDLQMDALGAAGSALFYALTRRSIAR